MSKFKIRFASQMTRHGFLILPLLVCFSLLAAGQAKISGLVKDDLGNGLSAATVMLNSSQYSTITRPTGEFEIADIPFGTYTLIISYVGFETHQQELDINTDALQIKPIRLAPSRLEEVVVSGTLKEMRKLDSPVPVEVYQPTYFKRNPTPNMYEALQNVNGVRPQINCNVCNTGDIHINGLEGPYTMVLVDGMPIVSGLATVYGLSGIPNSMIERVEIVKGPASTLYGSEAVGGLINVITKNTADMPLLSIDVMGSSWLEYNLDLAVKLNASKKLSVLTGVNYFNYQNPIDHNQDNFTDVTLQDRVSVFQKWSYKRKDNRQLSIAARYLYEDRWGGELQWTPEFRGGDSIYAESIYTNRGELIGQYQLPTEERLMLSTSLNFHNQNSVYGDMPFHASQAIGFSQLTWDKELGRHDLLAGAAYRYTYYDDNTVATGDSVNNRPSHIYLPGIFIQDEIGLSEKWTLLVGMRYDHNSAHGNIYTPRFALKWKPDIRSTIRLNGGTGFRVVNLFTEEHAALTGARDVVIMEELNPEQSYNVNLNVVRKFYIGSNNIIGLDASTWYTIFSNQIIPDYDSDPNEIIYDNLDGYSVSRGVSLNLDLDLSNRLVGNIGGTYIDVFVNEPNDAGEIESFRPVLTETWTGIWSLSYKFRKWNTTLDYTGNLYGPMRLPTLGPLDPRAEKSPWWSIQNIQLTYKSKSRQWEIYGGVKNLLNFTPPANSIARAFDPFDKQVQFDANGNAIANSTNPYGQTFDPSYVYAPNQGIRGFMGFRLSL